MWTHDHKGLVCVCNYSWAWCVWLGRKYRVYYTTDLWVKKKKSKLVVISQYSCSFCDKQLLVSWFIVMPHYRCPCGSLLNSVSSARSLRLPCLRLFISIKTMKVVTRETKVCDSCRAAYYVWKKNNSEFGGILSRVEKESLVDVESDAYESSVNE